MERFTVVGISDDGPGLHVAGVITGAAYCVDEPSMADTGERIGMQVDAETPEQAETLVILAVELRDQPSWTTAAMVEVGDFVVDENGTITEITQTTRDSHGHVVLATHDAEDDEESPALYDQSAVLYLVRP